MHVRVEWYAGARAEETPRRLLVGGRWVNVARVADRWQAPDGRGFRLRGDDDLDYVVHEDDASGQWRLGAVEAPVRREP